MKKILNLLKVAPLLALTLLFVQCEGGAGGETTDVVESGTYEGTIDEVEPEKDEIYVVTEDDQRLELYFTDETRLLQNGEEVDFSELNQGDRVRVTVEKVGQRLDPVEVVLVQ